MSGFNKRSRLAPQGSGKTPPAKGASDKPAPTAAAKPSPAVNKKLQWSIGDVLNKLDNPDEVIADAKASVEVPPAQAPQAPATPAKSETKQTSEKPSSKSPSPEKPKTSDKKEKVSQDESKSAEPITKSSSDKVDTPREAAKESKDVQPEGWNEPIGATAPVPSWEAKADPESAKAEYAWDLASGKAWQQEQTADASKSQELWGKSADQAAAPLWSAEQPSAQQWESKESPEPDLWAKPDTDQTGWEFGSSYQAASPDLWAAGKAPAVEEPANSAQPAQAADITDTRSEDLSESKTETSAAAPEQPEPSATEAHIEGSVAAALDAAFDSSSSVPTAPVEDTASAEPAETAVLDAAFDSSSPVPTAPVEDTASAEPAETAVLDAAFNSSSPVPTAPVEDTAPAEPAETTSESATPETDSETEVAELQPVEPVLSTAAETPDEKLEADLDTATPPDSWNEPSTAQEALSQPEAKPEQAKTAAVEEVEPWDNPVTTAPPDVWQQPAATTYDTAIGKEPAAKEETKPEEPAEKKENKEEGGIAMRAAALLMKKAAAKKSEILHDESAAKAAPEPSTPIPSPATQIPAEPPRAEGHATTAADEPELADRPAAEMTTLGSGAPEPGATAEAESAAPQAVPSQFSKPAGSGPVPSQFKRDVQTETSKISQKDLDKFAAATAKTQKKEETPKSTPVVKPAEPAAAAANKTTTPPSSPVPADVLDQIGRKDTPPKQPLTPSRPKETFSSLRSAPVLDNSIKAKLKVQTNRHQRTLVAATAALLLVVVGWFTWTFKERQDIGARVELEFANKQYADALVDVNKALVLYPNEARLHYMKGALLNMQGQAAQALPELMSADSQQPGNPEVIQERAKAYVALNKFPEAINDYNKILSDKKSLKPEFFVGRGTAYVKSGQPEKALQDFNQAVNLAPKNLTYRISRANALSALKKYTSAISDWNFIISKQPQNSVAYAERGLAEYRAKNPTRALADIQTSLQKDGTATALFYRGVIRADEKQFAPAIADFTSALKYDPSNAVILAAKAQALAATGDFDRALRDYNSLAGLQGVSSAELDSTRARTAMAAGQYKQAADDYAKLIAKNPDDPKLRLNHAQCCEKMGDFSKAYDDYSFVIGKEPSNADLYLKRGNMNVKQKRYKLANDDYQQAINLKNNNAEAYLARGLGSESQGLYDQALVDVNHALKLQPGNELARAKSRELTRMRTSHNAPAPIASLPAPPKVSVTGDNVSDGYKQMVAGDFSSAVQNFAVAIKKQPNNPLIRRYMAYSLVEAGQPAEAVEQFKALASLGALGPEDHTKYATALTNAGRQEDALEYLKRYITQSPENFSARMSLANLFLAKEQFMNAEETLKNGAQYAKTQSQVQQLQQLMEAVRQKTRDISVPANTEPTTRVNSG